MLAHARLDGEGRLLSADIPIDALNVRAGGEIGAVFALPPLAAAVQIALRLGMIVSRRVVVADDEADIALWIRIEPDGDGLRLAASGWHEERPWRCRGSTDEARHDFATIAADWCWDTDAALRLTFVSPSAGRRHGFCSSAMLGQPITELLELRDDARQDFTAIDRFDGRRPLMSIPAIVRASRRSILISASVRHDSAGGFAGYVGGSRDMPGDKEAPLTEMFMDRVGPALRAPLGRIIANADSIHAQIDGPLQGDYVDYAADIASAGRHLLSLVDDLVDVQGIERNDFVLALEPIDLADLARRAAGLLAVRAGHVGVTITRPAVGERMPASGEFRRALQILVNVIGNAVRYAPPNSGVEVIAERVGDKARVSVRDAGKGILPEDQTRVFEKFERVDVTEAGGNGLGLYIARRLARAMGGDLTVESAPGKGARFTLTLPADPSRDQDHDQADHR